MGMVPGNYRQLGPKTTRESMTTHRQTTGRHDNSPTAIFHRQPTRRHDHWPTGQVTDFFFKYSPTIANTHRQNLYCSLTVSEAWNSLSTLGPVLVFFHITGIWHALAGTYSSLVQTLLLCLSKGCSILI